MPGVTGSYESGTGVLNYGDKLTRQKWIREGMIQKRTQSFWYPYTGMSSDNMIYQTNLGTGKDGITVVFDYDGNYAGRGFMGKETAFGRGGSKKKFSSQLSLKRVRYPIENGDKFDGKIIGDLRINEHTHSRGLLLDNFIRAKDQYFFNAFQGCLDNMKPSHVIIPKKDASTTTGMHTVDPEGSSGATTISNEHKWTFQFLQDIEEILSTGDGFTRGERRAPLLPWRNKHVVFLDSSAHQQLLKDEDFIKVMQQADVRGTGNTLLKNQITEFGNLLLVKMPNFFGESVGTRLADDIVEIAGSKKIDASGKFQGDSGFATSGVFTARSFIAGANALQFAMGESPDYKLSTSQDFDIMSESAMIVHTNVQKTKLKEETDDYLQAKYADMDFGVVAIDSYYKGE